MCQELTNHHAQRLCVFVLFADTLGSVRTYLLDIELIIANLEAPSVDTSALYKATIEVEVANDSYGAVHKVRHARGGGGGPRRCDSL